MRIQPRVPSRRVVVEPEVSLRADPRALPAEPGPLIGRKRETAEILRLASSTRLLTVTGAGGIGKSRVALHAAWMLQEGEQERVAMVSGFDWKSATDVDVLVVDDCDAAGPELAARLETALAGSRRLRVIATSRRPLGLPGEVVWRIPGLGRTDEDEAVHLFAVRAAAVHPGFSATSPNVDVIARLCDELDRIPLAIELAARWLGVLSLEQLHDRIRHDHQLLQAANRALPDDHRSLDACLARTWRLARASAQEVWSRLSVFDSDFSFDAATAVIGSRTESELLLDVRELTDLAVLTIEDSGPRRRIRLLNTTRRYGREHLHAWGQADAARNRHLAWCIQLAEEVDARWRGPEQTELFDRLEAERSNLNQALEWACSDRRRREPALRLGANLCWFWHLRGYVPEGRAWLARALVGSRATTPARAKALTAAGFLAYMNGDTPNGLSLMEKSLSLRRRLGDRRTFAFALMSMGILQFYSGEPARARTMLEESIRLNRALGERVAAYVGLYELAEVEAAQGEYERALKHHEESLRAKTAQGDLWHIAWSHFGLGLLHWMRHDYEAAADYHLKALAMRRDLREWHGVGMSLEGLAWVAAYSAQPERAARLLGAAEALWEALGAKLPPYWLEHHGAGVRATRAALSEERFQTAWTQGRTMGRYQAVDYALRGTTSRERAPKAAASGAAAWLTGRELEIAKLIARGLMNRQIAEVLGIAERTAESHVEHIRNKLDFNSRAQIAAWAVEQGLIGGTET